ncbi:MAG: hypothetical protein A2166_02695 [Omnitrophica WOR_2 bacterium RBG_13_41_10]|nr:MAG: hypothetical protein A2166_02695 [Omnitrophica WOR_2 bacterium RBG_13_41_10]
MKVIFVAMGSEIISLEALSAMLKKYGHQTQLAFDRALFDDKQYITVPFLAKIFDQKKEVIKKILESNPGLIGFSVFADNYQWCLSIAREVKKMTNAPIIFGGIHPTSVPEKVIAEDCVDIICLGEGEYPLLELVESIKKGKIDYGIQNLWFKKNGAVIKNPIRTLIENLDDLPMIDKELFEKVVPIKEYYLTVTSKGCIYACSYCSQNFLKEWEKGKGRFLREKSVDCLLNELKIMKERYNFKRVDIKNNVLSGSKKWTLEFLNRYKEEIGVPFRIMGHPKTIDNEVAHALKDAGCWHVQLGVETLNEKLRKEILLRNETNYDIFTTLNAMDREGLHYSIDLMIGLPGEQDEDIIYAIRSFVKLRYLTRISVFWLEYLPRLAITRIAREKGIINDSKIIEIEEGRQEHYLSTGSVREQEKQKKLKNYQLMFRIIPITPESFINFILKHNLYIAFRFMPQTIILILVDVIVSFIKRDYWAIYAMQSYVWEIKRRFMLKFK